MKSLDLLWKNILRIWYKVLDENLKEIVEEILDTFFQSKSKEVFIAFSLFSLNDSNDEFDFNFSFKII